VSVPITDYFPHELSDLTNWNVTFIEAHSPHTKFLKWFQ
jgi:hypothetical protein